MKYPRLLFILICLPSLAWTQGNKPVKQENILIINVNSHLNNYSQIDGLFKHQRALPSLEYQIHKDKHIISLEIAKLYYNQKEHGQNNPLPNVEYEFLSRNFQAAIRSQYLKRIPVKNGKWQPYYGLALGLHYARTHRIPRVSTSYPISISSLMLDQQLSLGTLYNLGRYYLQANALLGISSIGINNQNISNPALVQSAQKYSLLDINILPYDYNFRVGIGMRL